MSHEKGQKDKNEKKQIPLHKRVPCFFHIKYFRKRCICIFHLFFSSIILWPAEQHRMRMVKTPLLWCFCTSVCGCSDRPSKSDFLLRGQLWPQTAGGSGGQQASGRLNINRCWQRTLFCVGYLLKSSLGSCYFLLLTIFRLGIFAQKQVELPKLLTTLKTSHKP